MGLITVIIIDVLIFTIASYLAFKRIKMKVINDRVKNKLGMLYYFFTLLILIPVSIFIPLVGVYLMFKLDIGSNFGAGATILVLPVFVNIFMFIISLVIGCILLSKTPNKRLWRQ